MVIQPLETKDYLLAFLTNGINYLMVGLMFLITFRFLSSKDDQQKRKSASRGAVNKESEIMEEELLKNH